MTTFCQRLYKDVQSCIDSLAAPECIGSIVTSGAAFSRRRKISFQDVVNTMLFAGPSPLQDLCNSFYSFNAPPTKSAFIQARDKILPEAFERLFRMVNAIYPCSTTLENGMPLIACDGSGYNTPYDPSNKATYMANRDGAKGRNQLHLNCLYDVLSQRYIDCIIQGVPDMNETAAMSAMVDRYEGPKSLFVADRNYPSLNNMAHIHENGHHYIIRIKDIDAQGSLLRSLGLPESGEFDETVHATLTRRRNKATRGSKGYKILSDSSPFDFIDSGHPYYEASYRVIRYENDGGWYCLITNLPEGEYPKGEVIATYWRRWDIEKSYFHLKYAACLNCIHSRKNGALIMEAWAAMTLYNISSIAVMHEARRLERKGKAEAAKRRKHEYKINFTTALHSVRESFWTAASKKAGGVSMGLGGTMSASLTPIRPGRANTRKLRKDKRTVSFCVRYC